MRAPGVPLAGTEPQGQDRPVATPLFRAKVEGPSMIPTLAPGETVWVLRTSRIRPGDVVVARHPGDPGRLLVKRAVRAERGGWWIEGEITGNGLADSNAFGPVPAALVVGRVVWPRRAARE